MADEVTLVLIKPDAIQRRLIGYVLSRLEQLNLEVIGAKAVHVSRGLAKEHYKALTGKPFFENLLEHIQGKLHGTNYVLAFALQGHNAISRVRKLSGATHPEQADPGTIRGSLGRISSSGTMENVLHASSDKHEAAREIRLWFKPHELLCSKKRPCI